MIGRYNKLLIHTIRGRGNHWLKISWLRWTLRRAPRATVEMNASSEPTGEDFREWTKGEALARVTAELDKWSAVALPPGNDDERGWRALALRRDIKTLLKKRPEPTGNEETWPAGLGDGQKYQHLLVRMLSRLDTRLQDVKGSHPFNAVYAPWEGGVAAESARSQQCQIPIKIAAFNVQGKFGRGAGYETHDQRVFAATAALHKRGIIIAIISEPRLAEGMLWPEAECGYRCYGERSAGPDTLVALVWNEAVGAVAWLENVSGPRATWLELPTKTGVLLLLGVYPKHSSAPAEERLRFWQDRVGEFHQLLRNPRFRHADLVVLGDFDLHSASVATANKRYERQVDR